MSADPWHGVPANRVVAGLVAALHLLLVWWLCSSLASRQVPQEPPRQLEVRLLRPEPPSLRSPPPRLAWAPPAVPPPPFVPPPEVALPPPETTAVASDLPQASTAGSGKDAPQQSSGRGPGSGGSASTPPQIDFSRCGKPAYPDVNAQGTTLIVFTMDVTGAISDAQVAETSGPTRRHQVLDRLARDFVLSCRGTPGTVNGQPVPLRGLTPITWQLTR